MCCPVARSQRSLKDAIGERIQLLHERRSSIQKFVIIDHEQTSLSSSESIYIELIKTIRQIYISQLFIGGTQSRLLIGSWVCPYFQKLCGPGMKKGTSDSVEEEKSVNCERVTKENS